MIRYNRKKMQMPIWVKKKERNNQLTIITKNKLRNLTRLLQKLLKMEPSHSPRTRRWRLMISRTRLSKMTNPRSDHLRKTRTT